jgi:mRNA interferase RelE/StbE
MYRVTFRRSAKKALDSLPKPVGDRITMAIAGLRHEPRPPGCRKIVGSEDGFRIRVGRYRVIYEVRDKESLVVVMKVVLRAERSYRGV